MFINHFFSRNDLKGEKPLSKLISFESFAHHPTCHHYNNHLISLFKKKICLGCFFTYFGILIGSLLYFFQNISAKDWWVVWLCALVLFIPTIGQFWIKNKIFKSISRFFLGICITFLILTILFNLQWDSIIHIFLKIILTIKIILVYKITQKYRQKYMDNPCLHCDKGQYPLCEYNLPKINNFLLVEGERLKKDNPEFYTFLKLFISGLKKDDPSAGNMIEFAVLGNL